MESQWKPFAGQASFFFCTRRDYQHNDRHKGAISEARRHRGGPLKRLHQPTFSGLAASGSRENCVSRSCAVHPVSPNAGLMKPWRGFARSRQVKTGGEQGEAILDNLLPIH